MPQFDPSTFSSQIFWLLLSFSTLLLVMVRYLIPRLDTALLLREKYIRELTDNLAGLEKKKKQQLRT